MSTDLLAIAGLTTTISPTINTVKIVHFDNFTLLVATLTMLLLLRSGTPIGRMQGAALFFSYIA